MFNQSKIVLVFQFNTVVFNTNRSQPKWHYAKDGCAKIEKKFHQMADGIKGKDEGWNSLFWNNHDLPRIVSTWGDDGDLQEMSNL